MNCSAPRSRRLRSAAHYNPDLDIAPVDDYGSISDEAMPAASGTYVGEATRPLIIVVAGHLRARLELYPGPTAQRLFRENVARGYSGG